MANKINKFYHISFIVLILQLAFVNVNAQESYLWPTDASKLLTSTFGEYRPDRIHAGIDIKTWNREGYKAFAISDGYISRIRVSPFGYGKSIYLKLNDGNFAVYAHLSDFTPEIKKIVSREQIKKRRYSVDLWFSSGDLPVKKGEILAYTGRSGSKLPHLHFEFRDKLNRPLNPLIQDFSATDNAAPVPAKLFLKPMNIESHVNFDWKPVIIYPKRRGKNMFELSAPVQAWGEIGLSLDAYDVNGEYDNKYGIYKIQLLVAGKEVFSVKYDRFDYNQNKFVNLDRDYGLLRNDTGKFYNLFVMNGNKLPFYDDYLPGEGIIKLEDQGKNLPFKIVVSDIAGNKSTLKGVFSAASIGNDNVFNIVEQHNNGLAESSESGTKTKAERKFRIEKYYYHDFLRLSFRSAADLISRPVLKLIGKNNNSVEIDVKAKSKRSFIAAVPMTYLGGKEVSFEISGESEKYAYSGKVRVHTQRVTTLGKKIILKNSAGEVVFGKDDLYRDTWLRQEIEEPADVQSSIELIGDIITLEPKDEPLRSDILIRMKYPKKDPAPDKLGIYARDNDGEWHYIKSNIDDKRNFISASFSSLETVTVIRDTIPPEIFKVQPAEKSIITNRSPEIRVSFDDLLSGINDDDDIWLYLDGKLIIAEWDPIYKYVKYVPENDLEFGSHVLKFEARDKLNNRVEKSWEFTIRR